MVLGEAMKKTYTQEQAPAFQFYANDWISDPSRMAMTLEQQGIQILLYSHCWRAIKLPYDYKILAKYCGTTPSVIKKAWPNMKHLFHKRSGYIYCLQAEEERHRQAEYRMKKQNAGKKGAEIRWAKDDVRQD